MKPTDIDLCAAQEMHEEHAGNEAERYEEREGRPYRFALARREFAQLFGSGLLFTVVAPALVRAQDPARGRGRAREAWNDRLHLGADGSITVMSGKVEVGQGSRTQIAMAAAEELGLEPAQIRVVLADTSATPDDGGTSGSRTTSATIPRVRRACAAVREMLRAAAAKRWTVDATAVEISGGVARHAPSGKSIALAELVSAPDGIELGAPVPEGIEVVRVGAWKVLGRSVPRAGALEIATGRHRYPSDIARAGMLYGVVLRPPSFGAELKSIALEPIAGREGLTAVRDGAFIGFAARTSAEARVAREEAARSAVWVEQAQSAYSELATTLRRTAKPPGRGRAQTRGSFETALAAAPQALRATYEIAYVQHAPLEPRAAVAEWSEETVTIWTGTQNPDRVRTQVAEAFRIEPEKVRVIVPDTGGAFGGKHTGEVAIEAARLARAASKPVSVCWSREEEFTWAYFRPAAVMDLAAGLDAQGGISAWQHVTFNAGASSLATPYDAIPHVETRSHECDAPLRQGSYRALAATANTFARECFLDELATAAHVDPLAFRRAHLGEPRLRRVLDGAAEAFGWERRRAAPAPHRGIGIACGTEKGSFIATCVEIAVDPSSKRYRILEIVAAFECGAIQNRKNLEAQVVGALVQGLGPIRSEEIRFRNGRIEEPNFAHYEVPRFRDVPEIRCVLVDAPDLPSIGAGETPIIALAPAVGNALCAASGARLRALPLRGEGYGCA